MKKYDLYDKKRELEEDIKTFSRMIDEDTNKTKRIMYRNLINSNQKEIAYIEDYIKRKGPSIEDYDYIY